MPDKPGSWPDQSPETFLQRVFTQPSPSWYPASTRPLSSRHTKLLYEARYYWVTTANRKCSGQQKPGHLGGPGLQTLTENVPANYW